MGTPIGDIQFADSESSFTFMILTLLVSILDIDSSLLLFCLRLYVLIALLDVLLVLVESPHKNYLGYHLPTRG